MDLSNDNVALLLNRLSVLPLPLAHCNEICTLDWLDYTVILRCHFLTGVELTDCLQFVDSAKTFFKKCSS